MSLAKITVDECYKVQGSGDASYQGLLSDEQKSQGYLMASKVANCLILPKWDWDVILSYCRLYWIYDLGTGTPTPCLQLKLKPRSGLVGCEAGEIEIQIKIDAGKSRLQPHLLVSWVIDQIPSKVAEECDRRNAFWIEQSARISHKSK